MWWPWLLVALFFGVVAWFLFRRYRRNQVIRAWEERFRGAVTEAYWVEDALAAQVASQPTAEEAATVWGAAQPRLLSIDEGLHALSSDAPDVKRASAANELREHLGRLTEALGTDVSQGASASPDTFRANRAAVDAVRRDLRDTLSAAGQPAPNLTDSR